MRTRTGAAHLQAMNTTTQSAHRRRSTVRLSPTGLTGWALIVVAASVIWRTAPTISGLTVLGLELAVVGTVLVARVMRRNGAPF